MKQVAHRSGGVSRRVMLAGMAMMATGSIAFALRPRSVDAAHSMRLGPLVPNRIGPWRFVGDEGLVIARSAGEVDGPAEGYDQLVARVYAAPGQPTIMLLLAYGGAQGGGLQLHRPETCYPGQGFTLADYQDVTLHFAQALTEVRARRFTAYRDDRVERLLYWTRIGERFPRSTADEYGAILASTLSGKVADGLLVRMSVIGDDIASTDVALVQFARAMVTATPASGQRMLIGSTVQPST